MKNNRFQNPINYIFNQYKKNPNKTCIIYQNKKISYEKLVIKILEFSKKLINIKKGEKVLITINDPIKHIISIYSCFYNSLIPMPYSTKCSNEVDKMIEYTNCKAVIVDKSFQIKKKNLLIFFSNQKTLNFNVNENKLNLSKSSNKVAMIYFTSGTTSGINKGVLQSFKNLEFTKKKIIKKTNINEKIIEIICTPIFNCFWFGRVNSIFSVGGAIVLIKNSFNPLIFFNYIKEFKINAISGDTGIYLFLIKYFKKNLIQISKKILWIKIASQPMPLNKKKELMKIFLGAKIVMGYGLTEAMRTTLLSFFDEKRNLSSDGKVTKDIRIKILNNNKQDLGRNNIGNVFIKGNHLAIGYLKKNRVWKNRMHKGYYNSGDLGFISSSGYLHLKGRSDDAINVGGKIVSLNEVDEILKRFIKKTNFVSLGIDDSFKITHKKLVICIEKKWIEKISWSKLKIKLGKIIDFSLIPDEVYIANKIPKTNNGKTLYQKIRTNIKNKNFKKLI